MTVKFEQGLEVWSLELRQGGPLGYIGNFIHSNTQNQEYNLPDKSGTIALLSDIPNSLNLSGDVTLIGNIATLVNTGVTPGTYNNDPSTITPFTVDAKGRITGIGNPVTISGDDNVVLSEPMASFTCFRINSNNQAFKVTANDDTLVLVEGMTLESGGIGSQVKVARIKNKPYVMNTFFNNYQLYWLTSTGNISTSRPTNTRYQVMIGHSVPNSNTFIFDPQLPILLSQQ